MHKLLLKRKRARYVKNKKKLLSGRRPLRRGIVSKAVLRSPKKPHSSKRATVKFYIQYRPKMKNYAYVLGEGAKRRLRKYDVIFFRGGRRRDIPAMKYTAVYGVRTKGQKSTTLIGLIGQRKKARSKYGARLKRDLNK
jgi:ribosomal protein S12